MGSVLKKITKRANKVNNYLQIIEKHLKEASEKSGEVALTQPFDLGKTVENDLNQSMEKRRKDRNKRKAKRKAEKK